MTRDKAIEQAAALIQARTSWPAADRIRRALDRGGNTVNKECHELIVDEYTSADVACRKPAVGHRYDQSFPGDGLYLVCRAHHQPPYTASDTQTVEGAP